MLMRAVKQDDFDLAYQLYMDKTVNPYMSFPEMPPEEFAFIYEEVLDELRVFEEKGEVLAFIGVHRRPFRSSHICYLHKFAVMPKFQNQGIGQQVFALLIADLRKKGITRLELGVESDNHRAIIFYKRLGFQIYGTSLGYFNREGEIVDEHFMGLVI